MVLIAEMNHPHDPPEIIRPVRIIERHAPPLRLGRKAAQQKHLRPNGQEGLEGVSLGVHGYAKIREKAYRCLMS